MLFAYLSLSGHWQLLPAFSDHRGRRVIGAQTGCVEVVLKIPPFSL